MFSVDAVAAQRMIDYSGLEVCRFMPGRAIVVLMLMHYLDGDLGQYHEFGTNVMVNPPGSKASGPRALQSAGAFVHHLPVDQAFTLEAGQVIWGYPKVMADFTVRAGNPLGFDVHVDGQLVASMDFQAGLPIPSASLPATQVYRTYSHRDGVTRETGGSRPSPACGRGPAACGCGSGSTSMPTNCAPSGCRNGRSSPSPAPTSR
jgi:hypothetical protein